jgi:RNA polymerase sigma-70 factor (ECF subfamily)
MIAFLDLIDDYEDKIRFKELYNEYLGLIVSIARSKVHTSQDVEDAVQDTLFYIAKNFNRIGDLKSASTKCYIATITEGIAINRYNKETKYQNYKVHSSISEDLIDGCNLDVYDITDIKLVIDNLCDEYRNLIYLTYVFGYKSKEIAQVYNMSDSNVRKKLQFARAEIKKQLER